RVFTFMPFGRLKFSMHPFMRKIQEKRFFLIAVIQPFQGIAGQQIGGITTFGLLDTLAVNIKRRIIIHALSAETQPVIESRLRRIVGIAHVPFTHKSSLIASLLKILRKEN